MTVAAVDAEAPQLEFRVERVEAAGDAVVPTLVFTLRIDAAGREIRSLVLDVQVRIDAVRRRYDDGERERLFELFGAPAGWGRSLRSLRWTATTVSVPAFAHATTVELAVPCTYDFDVVASKYLNALEDGEVPLELLFSGSVFFSGADGRLQVVRLSWDREARFSLPVRVWRDAVERAFPGAAWLRLSRDVFDRLHAYRSREALLTWDSAIESLLDAREAG